MNWDWQKFWDKIQTLIVTYAPKVIIAIIVLIVGFWLIRQLNKWVKKALMGRKTNPTLRYFLQNLVAISLQVILVVMALQIAGIQVTFLSAIIAGFTVAAGLALSGTLQNFVSGILILFLKPYRVGDNIIIQTQEGTVTAIQLFYTTVLTFDNKTIIVPNGQLSNNVVINLSREGKRRLDIEMKFSYGIDIAHVKQVVLDSIHAAKEVLDEPVARVGVWALEPDKYALMINVWIDAHGFFDTKLLLQEKLITDIKNAGIKLPGM
ncbi:MAG: mechanosensitive ion channel family protein [Chitinophagaceae bacterium]|nr:mechanosensitive ion channel family protein [Chitinophagaceae bacterium]